MRERVEAKILHEEPIAAANAGGQLIGSLGKR